MSTHQELTGTLQGRLGVRLFFRYVAASEPHGTVLLLHGFGEHSGRYAHVLSALADAGLSTLAVDHRGHGRSEGRRAYVNRFVEYLDDTAVALAKAAELGGGAAPFLCGHSFGGLVAAAYAIERGTEGMRALALSGPAFEFALRLPAWKTWLGRAASKHLPTLAIPAGVDPAQLSRDPAVGRAYVADPLVLKSATARWYTETVEAQARALAGAAAVRIPTLVMHGAADAIIAPAGSERFFAALGAEDKTLRLLPGARHEILNEIDKEDVLRELVAWLKAR